ncbi:GAF and ANTAR domain-containing protein [Nocardia sp. NBC_01327]|uniref:GAF and ANTAR domain-containing protein n=1 Tax=Nocardia sp. NBC_01327 TaxID=2903593 RepID=UPI002E157596|nr:GAF and ANTAR domain-containing protein [Nocardia sp. NBC_01327]
MTGRERALIAAFVQLADTLVANYDPVELAQELVDAAVALLPVTAGGVLLVDYRDQLQVLSSTSEGARLLELFELQSRAGPCLTAFRTGRAVLVEDLDHDQGRWPAFARRAREDGVRSVYALPMRLREERIGALNLFATSPGRLDEDQVAIAQALADVATIGILHARVLADHLTVAAHLQGALNTRVVIEQAKGLLAERGGLDMDAAFQALRAHARHTNTRLADLARAVITREVDATAVLTRLADRSDFGGSGANDSEPE